MTFLLRPALPEDQRFLFDTYRLTLRAHVEWAWGWNEEFQREGFFRHHPVEVFQVIEVAGLPVGGLHVERLPDARFIRMIFLQPEWQGCGIGTAVLRQEIARACTAGQWLQLKVIKSNPARRLYDRLGFVVLEEDTATWLMQHQASIHE